ncbi:MAG TPA: hypothetical protein VHE35_23160 [Kofleriaceae bacterium]|nr:hypothetical protein [Kofleriaceae bacterium]
MTATASEAREAREALAAIHRELDRVFELARELLVVGDGPHAARALAAYAALTAAHAEAEERLLLPRLPPDARWPAALYVGQHRKLLVGLDRAADLVAAVRAPAPRWRVAALCALDTLIPVLHLAEHHHQAEEEALFPVVPAAALAAVAAAWPAAVALHAGTLATCQAALDHPAR